jgi:hypothetical protein
MNDHLGKIFNWLCLNKYGGGRWPDAEMEQSDPELYNMFIQAFKEREEATEECEPVQWSLNDRLSFCKFMLECVVENDWDADHIELDHDLGYTTYTYQQIAKMTLEAFEQYEQESTL